MFKKTNQLSPQPNPPPSIEEILEDLETFKVEKLIREKVQNYHKINELQQENAEDDEWFKVFEKFMQDYQNFNDMKNDIEELRQRLLATQNELQEAKDDIQRKIDENLEKIHRKSSSLQGTS
uniref:Uncharacterized protein n=1 Tax=Corethrella appendiculata TaxID=1370023 RepID=U5ESJ8_9DIPT